ncbi:MAG: ParB/RepB/Spo0J family partition protein [Lachnospiraceae bacterium]|nr:ParB/RepB/Spo0J family partition protein [Lachnospiraceae bacterium]
MPKKGLNVSLQSYDDIFSTEESRQTDKLEHVQQIPLEELHPFKNHPFKVIDDESMLRTVESIAQFGVLSPAIARPSPDGGYELISGHRRHHAAELAGLASLPVIIRDMDDDAATILMVDSNLQREQILPSERAQAYKMKLEAVKRQGERRDLTSGQLGPKLGTRSNQIVADEAGESVKQVQRYIRLTNLIPELLDKVDNKEIAFNPAVELSYLSEKQQQDFLEAMTIADAPPSLSQAQRIKKLSQDTSSDNDPSKPDGACSLEAMCGILEEQKKPDLTHVTLKTDVLRKYFPKSYTPKQMEDTIIKLLDQWQKKKKREQSL